MWVHGVLHVSHSLLIHTFVVVQTKCDMQMGVTQLAELKN